MFRLSIFLASILATIIYADQTYPGTKTRPILWESEAAQLSVANYLQGWIPEDIVIPSNPDYVVGNGQEYTDIQAAVNAAINAGGSTRRYIRIEPGTYEQTIFLPFTVEVPLTFYGTGNDPEDVKIVLSQGAKMDSATYANQVNPNGSRYKSGDPAWSIYNDCANKGSSIGTSCSTVFLINSDNVEITNLSVENPSTDGQAVALQTNGDKIHFDNVHFIGFQDTLCLGSGGTDVQRVFLNNIYVTGDVDFVFGGASAVFLNAVFFARADRPRTSAIIFAPNTDANKSYGYLIVDSIITGDSPFLSNKGVILARSWDANTPQGTYSPGVSPNGQLLIRETKIDGIVNVNAPYDKAATSSREFSGNNNTDRDLNDNNYNRLWEYENTGNGA